MEKDYFKIVRWRSGRRYSAFMTSEYGRRTVLCYPPGEWVEPYFGGIYVFGSVASLRRFEMSQVFVNLKAYEVWSCKGVELITPKNHKWYWTKHPATRRELTEFWKWHLSDSSGKFRPDTFAGYREAPKGTILCSKVKLVDLVRSVGRKGIGHD